MRYSAAAAIAFVGAVAAQNASSTSEVFCNAAAIARGDCTATAATEPTSIPIVCNAAAIARGDCTLTAAIEPSATSEVFCNAAAIARGDCSLTAAIEPSATSEVFCNAAAIARGDCSLTAAIEPSATPSMPLVCNAAAIARGDCSLTAAINGTATTAIVGPVYVTEVVTAYTTVCPAPTAGAYLTTLGSVVYTVSSATTITVTDCPCTITKPAPSGPAASACATKLFDGCNPARSACPSGPGSFITVTPSTYPTSYVVNGQTVSLTAAPTSCLPSSGVATTMTPSAGGNRNGTATSTRPAAFTGAAAQFGAGFGFLGAAAGAVMLL